MWFGYLALEVLVVGLRVFDFVYMVWVWVLMFGIWDCLGLFVIMFAS